VTTLIGVCDYGVGNLRSVERALQASGAEALISADPEAIAGCDGVVLPGVGAFTVAATALRASGLGDSVRDLARDGRPVLGVCLGHQLLFEGSDEGQGGGGLALLPGRVVQLAPGGGLKVPHMGWNTVTTVRESRLLTGVATGSYMYFVHSYVALAERDDTVAVTEYGRRFTVAVERGNVMGTQFHPEKSGNVGLQVYANFVSLCSSGVPARSVV
jgi:glutamine amidotransferase